MKILVGVPFFRISGLARRCLESLVSTPATVLVIDNAADKDVKDLVANEFGGRVQTIVNQENRYCNGGWNQILEYGIQNGYDVIGLGSSDATLHPGWYDALCELSDKYKDEIWVPSIGGPVVGPDLRSIEYVHGGLAGFFTFLPRPAAEAVYPIPHTLRHWFGDQYMYETLRSKGWKVTLLNQVRAYHAQSAITVATPEAYAVIEQDKREWLLLGNK